MSGSLQDVQEIDPAPSLDAQFRALYTSGIIGICRADRERIVDANDVFLTMVGYSRQELEAGKLRWPEMTPPEYAELDAQAVRELIETGRCSPFEKEYFRKDGTRVPIQIAAAAISPGSQQWVCYILDLSVPRRAAITERALDTVIEHVPVGVIVVDQTGQLVLMNKVGRQISGEAPSSETSVASQADAYALREPHTGQPLAPEDTPIGRALGGETVRNFEYVFRPHGSAEDRWVRAVAVPLADATGRSLGAVAVFEDVTEEREREQVREDFLATAAHDLKTPLTGIKGHTQLMQRRLTRHGSLGTDVLETYLQQTLDTAVRMEKMLVDLLDVARLQAGEQFDLMLERVNLVELVERVVESSAQASPIHTVRIETDTPDLSGRWDARLLERSIENLIANGITYSPAGGEVTVLLARGMDGEIPGAVVRVADRGIGIPARDLPRIFDRFYRGSNVVERFGGTGIGLYGVKQIAEQHGGRVTVQSREGEGSTFSLWLPLSPPE